MHGSNWRVLSQFPMYWFSVPAVMKGWIDRVLTMGYAFSEERRYSQGVFKVTLASCDCWTSGDTVSSLHTGQEGHSLLHHWVSRVNVQVKWH